MNLTEEPAAYIFKVQAYTEDGFTSKRLTLRCDIPVLLVKLQNIHQALEVKTQLYYIIEDGNS